MAIHRLGTAELTGRVPLGRVLVTIDDLELLMTLLSGTTSSDESSQSTMPVKVEFDGGYFTEAADLRRLTDQELEVLRVVSPELQVLLSRRQAVAIGSYYLGNKVYRDWARTRPAPWFPRYKGYIAPAAAAIFMIAFAIWGWDVYKDSPGYSQPKPWDTYLFLGLFALGIVGGILSGLQSAWQKTFAVIAPSSLSEYRSSHASSRVQRWSMLAGVASVFVAVVAIFVEVLVGK